MIISGLFGNDITPMFKHTLIAASVLIAAVPAFAIDRTVHPVDPSNFDVAGVRLGMPASEAATVAAAKLGVAASAVQYEAKPSMNSVVKAKVPAYFTIQSGKSKLTVSLLPREPVDAAKTLVVSEIKYVMEPSPQAEEAIAKSALAKYGKPSVARSSSAWCAKPAVTTACAADRGPQLHVYGVTVHMLDESLSKVKIAARGEAPKPAF